MLNPSAKAVENHTISENELRLFEAIPGNNLLVLCNPPHFTILGMTEGYLQAAGRQREQLLGKGIFEAFPSNPDDRGDTGENDLRFSFYEVINHKKTHHLHTQRYDVANSDGSFEEKYWNASNTPMVGESGAVKYIIHTAVEITYQVKAQHREERVKLFEQAHNLFMQAPLAIAILTGDQLVVELANEPVMEVWGKGRDILGKPISQVIPEIESQGFIDLMKEVVVTEKPFHAYEMPVTLLRNGKEEIVYFNFVYQPYYVKESTKPIGIIIFATNVTEHVQSKEKAEESAQRVRSLVESAPFPIGVYVGKEMRIELANQTIIDIYGKGPDVIGKRYTEILPELDNQKIFKQLDEVFTSGLPFHAQNQRVDIEHNGKLQTYYFNYSFTPLFDKNGNVYGVMNTAADITDLTLAKKEIELSEEKARLAIGSAELGTYEIHLPTNEMVTSERFREIWGVKSSTDRLAILASIHPDDLPVREKAMNEAFQTSNLNYEARLVQHEGDTKWVKVRGKIIFSEDGTPERIIGVIQDITEQKLFAQELSKQVKERTEELETATNLLLSSNQYLQQIINVFNTPLQVLQPVIENDAVTDFRYKMTNSAYAAYANTTPEVLQNKTVSAFFPNYFQTESFRRIVETYQTGMPFTWENHYAVDGLNIYNEMSTTKMGDEVVVHFSDFTKLKNLQLELLRKIEELERSNKNLEEFAYAASHDLKEPVRKIHFFGDRLKASLYHKLTEEEKGFFERMETASRRMSALIDDLLAYSQVSLRPRNLEEVDLNQLIELVLNDLDLEIDQNEAQIETEVLGTVQGHHRQLQQVFQNLLSNAIKYSKPGRRPQISISSQQQKGVDLPLNLPPEAAAKTFCVIEVKDNGIGFEQRDADRIFHVFTRLHGNVQYRGTGIGLSIVRKVIENHNGYVTAKSELDKGSVFCIYLPL
ncbi:MAG: PAS domain-containing protein [Flavisolibacter sp.]